MSSTSFQKTVRAIQNRGASACQRSVDDSSNSNSKSQHHTSLAFNAYVRKWVVARLSAFNAKTDLAASLLPECAYLPLNARIWGGNSKSHVRGAPFHPQTQGKIERWHQTLKNRVLLENYFLPGDLEAQIEAFVEHYNHQRYHENLDNVTPADAYFGRAEAIIKRRERIKRKTIQKGACNTAS